MVLLLNLLVILIYGAFCFKAVLWSLRWRMVRSVDLVTGMIFVFYALPLAYNILFGETSVWTGASPGLRAGYDLVLLCTLFLLRLAAMRRQPLTASPQEVARQWNQPMLPTQRDQILLWLGWLLMLGPPLAVIVLAPNPTAYLRYGTTDLRNIRTGSAASAAHVMITMTIPLAVFGFFTVFWVTLRQRRRFWTFPTVASLFLALVSAYINGKRGILFFILLIVVGVTWFEARLRLAWAALMAILFVLFSFVYLSLAKDVQKGAVDYIRGDLARDYTLVNVIRQSGWVDNKMLPYPGAGYLFQFVFPVPRDAWPEKPWPTSVYVTNAILEIRRNRILGWGYGIGFQEESLANFGYVGYGFVCLLVGRICRTIDRQIYERSSLFMFCWLPLLYGCVFAVYVIFTLTFAVLVPALIIALINRLVGPGQQDLQMLAVPADHAEY